MSAADAPGANQLRAFFERWQRLEEEKATIAEDLKELFAEAKGTGFDPKVMRVVFRGKAKEDAEGGADRADRQEFEATCELYRAALDGPRAHPAHSAREIIEEFDPETGEITDEPDAAADAAGDYLREPTAAASGQIIREGDAPRETDCQAGEASHGGSDASCPDTEFPSARSSRAEETGAAATAPEAAPVDHFEPPAFLARQKTMADYRPHCLEPEACRSSQLDHCYSCRKAIGEVAA